MSTGRFRDDGRRIDDFADHVIVVCPRCGERADVRPFDPDDGKDRRRTMAALMPRRLVCAHCALTRTHVAARAGFGRPTDPYFDLPLALQAPCAGHTIWAYNRAHLEHMLRWVEATVRQRAIPEPPNLAVPTSLLERMPGWFGEASNRTAISRTLRDLLASLD